MSRLAELSEIRFRHPGRVAEAMAARAPGQLPEAGKKLLIVAADHPGRGALKAGTDPFAMASREELLQRCIVALGRPGVDGFLGTPDIVEDLTLLGALEGKLVLGSMNRSGLIGASFEVDDRITAWTPEGIAAARLDGGKLLLRLDSALAAAGKIALLEPFVSRRADGRLANDLTPDAVIRSIAVASALGSTSRHTWLKLPCVPDMERVMAASSLPVLLLGGPVTPNLDDKVRSWSESLRLPNVKGLVIGRALLFPRDGDVAGAVDRIVEVL